MPFDPVSIFLLTGWQITNQLRVCVPHNYGYALKANGFDFDRQRHKWACFHTCGNGATPVAPVEAATYPPDECPYLARPYGQLINVDERFKDGSICLVRDVPRPGEYSLAWSITP